MARAARPPVLISALTGEGIEAMLAAMDARFGGKDEILSLEIPPGEGRLLSWLYDNTQVLEQQPGESGAVTARFRIDPTIKGKLEGQLRRAGLAAHGVRPSLPAWRFQRRGRGEGSDPRPYAFFGGGGVVSLTLGRASMRSMKAVRCLCSCISALLSGNRCK